VRYYGKWMRDEAFNRIGHLYPPVRITEGILADRPDLKVQGLKVGDELTVIAWLWARTVKCPNPACGVYAPLVRTLHVSTKKGMQAWLEPFIDKSSQPFIISFRVKYEESIKKSGTVSRNGAQCLVCQTPIEFSYVRNEGKLSKIGHQMLAIVCESPSGRVYLNAITDHEKLAASEKPKWEIDSYLPEKALGFRVQLYGYRRHSDLFTKRQMVILTTLSDLVSEVHEKVSESVRENNLDLTDYAESICLYLSFAIDKLAVYGSSFVTWYTKEDRPSMMFSRQAIPMVWDFVEINPFAEIGGSFQKSIEIVSDSIPSIKSAMAGFVFQKDALSDFPNTNFIISTDPPYYDNIGYSDLSDYFYVWLRASLRKILPANFQTLLVPKNQELVANPYRFNDDKTKAEDFFEAGLRKVFRNFRNIVDNGFPFTIYYAFKQSETDNSGDDGSIQEQVSRLLEHGLLELNDREEV
jgi:putative DNA methylase